MPRVNYLGRLKSPASKGGARRVVRSSSTCVLMLLRHHIYGPLIRGRAIFLGGRKRVDRSSSTGGQCGTQSQLSLARGGPFGGFSRPPVARLATWLAVDRFDGRQPPLPRQNGSSCTPPANKDRGPPLNPQNVQDDDIDDSTTKHLYNHVTPTGASRSD